MLFEERVPPTTLGSNVSRTYVYLGIIEALVFFVASQIGVFVQFGSPLSADLSLGSSNATGIVFALGMSLAMISMGLYQRGAQENEAAFVVRMGLAFLLGSATLAAVSFALPFLLLDRGVLGLGLVFSFGISTTRELFARLAHADSRKRRVLVLGTGVNARAIADLVARDSNLGFLVVAYVPLPGSQMQRRFRPRSSPDRPLADLLIERSIDEVVVAADDRRDKLPVDELVDCKLSGFEVLTARHFSRRRSRYSRSTCC